MRYHLFPFLRWPGARYRMLVHRDHKMKYFEDQTLMGEILEVLDRPWYRRLIRWPWFSWEVEATEQEINFYYWAPDVFVGNEIRKKILSMHPEMEITHVIDEDDLIDSFDRKKGFLTGRSLRLDRHYPVPIKSFYNEVVDTQSAIVNAISDLEKGQRCIIQVLIQPARRYQKSFDKAIRLVKQWDKENEYEKIELFEKNIAGKQNKQLAHCAIRIMALSEKKADARRIVNEVCRSFGQFKSEALNSFVARERWMHFKPIFIQDIKLRRFPFFERNLSRVILNIEELSGIARLPSEIVNNSRLVRLKMKHIEAPAEVLRMSNEVHANGTGKKYIHLGTNTYRMKVNQIYSDIATWRQHILIAAGSGGGKSVLLQNIIKSLCDLKKDGFPSGFFLIDPFGGVAQVVMSVMPKELYRYVNYVRPDPQSDTQFPFNIYDVDFATTEHSVAKNISDAIGRIWPEGWGPRPEQNFLLGGIALQRIGEASVINLERLLRDPIYTMTVADHIEQYPDLIDTGVVKFLREDILPGASPDATTSEKRYRRDMIDSTLNKLRQFTLSPMLNKAMGAKTCGFRWLESMNEGYINILDLGLIQNEAEKQMYASLAFTMNYQAAISRDSLSENLIYPIIADELPMVIAANEDIINEMADRTRQKNTPLIGATQGLVSQLEKSVANAIFRNFATQIMFRINHPDDARELERLFNDPRLTEADFKRTPDNHAYVRLNVGRSSSMPFSIKTNEPVSQIRNDELIRQQIDDTNQRAFESENEYVRREEEKQSKIEIGISPLLELSQDERTNERIEDAGTIETGKTEQNVELDQSMEIEEQIPEIDRENEPEVDVSENTDDRHDQDDSQIVDDKDDNSDDELISINTDAITVKTEKANDEKKERKDNQNGWTF